MDQEFVRVVSPDSLNGSQWMAIAWSLWWRSMVTTIIALVTGGIFGGILGGIIGVVMALLKLEALIKTVAGVAGGLGGLIVGFAMFYVWLRWTLKATYGELRLGLLSRSAKFVGSGAMSSNN